MAFYSTLLCLFLCSFLTFAYSQNALPHQVLSSVATVDEEIVNSPYQEPSPSTAAPQVLAQVEPSTVYAPPSEEDLLPTAEAAFTEEIHALAELLNHDPLKIYNWVRSEIEFSPVWGSVAGAQGCLETRHGTAFDHASLLVALLRVSGIHARYEIGDVEMDAALFMEWLGGFTNIESAASYLASAGTPEVVRRVDGDRVRTVRFKHVWVRAWIDYYPSRGARHVEGDAWIALDASFKNRVSRPARRLVDIATFPEPSSIAASVDQDDVARFDTSALDAYFAFDERGLVDELSNLAGHLSTREWIGGRPIERLESSIIPAAPPFRILANAEVVSSVAEIYQHEVSVRISQGGSTILEGRWPLRQLASQPVFLSYQPFSEAARSIAEGLLVSDGLDTEFPSRAFEVKPSLRINDVPLVESTIPISWRNSYTLAVTFHGPSVATAPVVNELLAGEEVALAFGIAGSGGPALERVGRQLQAVIRALDADFNSADLGLLQQAVLSGQVHSWFHQVDFVNEMAADTLGVVTTRFPSLAMARNEFGSLLAFDIDRDIVVTASKDGGQDQVVEHAMITGFLGSMLEALVPSQFDHGALGDSERQYVSTTTSMGIAQELGGGVMGVSEANLASLRSKLRLPVEEYREIESYVHAGMTVFLQTGLLDPIQGDPIVAYAAIDMATGSGAYLINGLGGSGAVDCAVDESMKPINAAMLKGGSLGLPAVSTLASELPELSGQSGLIEWSNAVLAHVSSFDEHLARVGAPIDSPLFRSDPLMGLGLMLAYLDAALEELPASAKAGLSARIGHRLGALYIGRIVEIEAAVRGAQLKPSCIADRLTNIF